MDFGRILSRAWEITWRWKILWLLGFLAALGQGTGGANSGYRFGNQDFQNRNLPGFSLPAEAAGLIVGLVCLAAIVGIVLWVLSVIARGGLIAGVAQIEDEGGTTLGRAWAAGQRRFWTLFGIGILMAVPLIIIVLAMIIGIFVLAGGAALVTSEGNQAIGPVIGSVLACICPSVCLFVIVALLLGQVRIYAERAAILEDLGWIDAFRRGWQVLRDNLGSTVVLWLIFLVIGLVIAAISAAILAPIVLPAMALYNSAAPASAPNWVLLTTVCGFGLLATIVAAIIGSIVETFTSATWTLAYRQMIAPRALPAAPLMPDAPVSEG